MPVKQHCTRVHHKEHWEYNIWLTQTTGKNLGREADIFKGPVKSNFAEKSFWTQAREQVDMKYR